MLNMEYIIIPTKVIGGQLGEIVFYNEDLYGEYAAASSYKLFKLRSAIPVPVNTIIGFG